MGTTAHGIWWPDDYNAAADLPVLMQQNANSIEAALAKQDLDEAAALAAAVPIGAIIAYGGATAPTSWHLCDGTAHGSTALQAVLGSANVPDLRSRFVVGAGSAYALKATGGADSVGLTIAQMPTHDHGAATQFANASHAHGGVTNGTDTTHAHPYNKLLGGASAGGADPAPWRYIIDEGNDGASLATTGAAGGVHTHGIPADNAQHQHGIAAQGSGVAHENRPPFYALTYIIRKA